MDQALIFENDHFGFAVGIVVVFPALRFDVVLKDATTPNGVVNLVFGGTDGVGPDFIHRRVALVVEIPLTCASIQASATCGSGDPDVIAEDADVVDDVVGEAGVKLREAVDAPGRDAAEAAEGGCPYIAGALVEREPEHCLVRQAITRME